MGLGFAAVLILAVPMLPGGLGGDSAEKLEMVMDSVSMVQQAPADMPDIRGIKVLRPGLELGEEKKGRFEPAHALAMWLDTASGVQNFSADSKEITAYLHGDVVESSVKGWCLVMVDKCSLGWGKGDGKVLKNHYPKGLRR